MVAAPFLALMFAIMETAIVFFAGQALETAVADCARLIMTGQAQTQGFNQAQFKTRGVRQDLRPVRLRRRPLGRREDLLRRSPRINTAKPIDANGNLRPNFGYSRAAPATSWWCA